ncbi:hypothetical protein HDU79_011667 [Rhizoclosmatium sp. JEL0117]|nr:hypothetical protein HDU79_011667 [Rhizoclosmatium sp. JEL0117]
MLVGTIPMELWTLTKLKHLDLRNGNLRGPLSPSIGLLANLHTLDLKQNKLSGTIPSTLSDCTHLISLSLSHNEFSGPIPPELGLLASLKVLDLRGNRLEGEIPKELGNCAELSELHLQDNQFTGKVPVQLLQFPHIVHLGISDIGGLEKVIDLEKHTVLNTYMTRIFEHKGFSFRQYQN